MKKSIVLISTIMTVLFLQVPGLLYGAIPAVEREALIALYNATDGDGWNNNSGWKEAPLEPDGFGSIGSEENWNGITVTEDHVTSITLIENNLIGIIPPELGNLVNLRYLYLNGNHLSGSIPPELGNLGNLKNLYLNSNQLTGSIPPELGNLGNLIYLYLHNNQLTGSIPPELSNLINLDILLLGNNRLTGSIPSELGNLVELESLYLYSNQLTGHIPPELGNLDRLTSFYVAGNQLTGSIPSSITNLTQLVWLKCRYNGLYTDDQTVAEFMAGLEIGWEETQTVAPGIVSAAPVSNTSIRVTWTPIIYTGGTGGYRVYYGTTSGGPWTYAGMTSDKLVSSYDLTGLIPGTKYYFILRTQTDAHFNNDNTVVSDPSKEVSAFTTIVSPGQDQPPFGSLDSPSGVGGPLSGSFAVSGWALDDDRVTSVKIYNVVGDSTTYIGEAVFVEGARPDIEQAYPGYLNNNRAGWGYMLLSHFLPNGGNGAYTLRAVAEDSLGKKTTLGNRTIICDNINAVKPFGAIDLPTQGGIVSGTHFRNQGWVLTPMPNKIPEDGSTIGVYVDGIFQGRPTYNLYREDIAALFPGYANSDGALAYYDFNPVEIGEGIHTIYWLVEDDAGNADGIGSRYFSIQNTNTGTSTSAWGLNSSWLSESPDITPGITDIPVDYSSPVRVRKGYNRNMEPRDLYPDQNGIRTVKIKELGYIEISLGMYNDSLRGFQIVGDQLKPLPIGSTLDSGKGVFYWSPGPGFLGVYRLVFFEESAGSAELKYINVIIF